MKPELAQKIQTHNKQRKIQVGIFLGIVVILLVLALPGAEIDLNKLYRLNTKLNKDELRKILRSTNTERFKPYIVLHGEKFIYESRFFRYCNF